MFKLVRFLFLPIYRFFWSKPKKVNSFYSRQAIFLLLLTPTYLNVQAQQATSLEHKAPTLQIGLDGLSLSKGALDYEVIAQMITEKQSELKLKFIQNLFLTRIEGAGGQTYSYVENILNSIITEKNPELRARQVLEQTVNMVFVSSYAKYYIGRPEHADDVTKLQTLAYFYNHRDEYNREDIKTETFKEKLNSEFSDTTRAENDRPKIGTKSNEFMALLLDMVSEAVRKDENLKRLGLMQISRSATYEYKNLYLKALNRKIAISEDITTIIAKYNKKLNLEIQSQLSNKQNSTIKTDKGKTSNLHIEQLKIEISKTVKNDIITEEFQKSTGSYFSQKDYNDDLKVMNEKIVAMLAKFTNHLGLVNYLVTQGSFRNSDIHTLERHTSFYNRPKSGTSDFIDRLKKIDGLLKTAVDSIARRKFIPDSTRKVQVENLVKVKSYLNKATNFLNTAKDGITLQNAPVLSDILYSITKEFVPALEDVTFNYPDIIAVNDSLKVMSETLARILMKDVGLDSLTIDQVKPFVLLTSELYQFDRAKTISDYLSYANDLISLFPDDKISTVFSYVNTFVKDYTVLKLNNKGKEVIEFNVEDFLVKLQNIRKERYSPFKFHFTVGLNTGYFKNNLHFKSDTLSSFSSVSEKNRIES